MLNSFIGNSSTWVNPEGVKEIITSVIEDRIDPETHSVLPEHVKRILTYDASTGEVYSVGPRDSVDRPGYLFPLASEGSIKPEIDTNGNKYLVKPATVQTDHAIRKALETVPVRMALDESRADSLNEAEQYLLSYLASSGIRHRYDGVDQIVHGLHVSSTDSFRGRNMPDFSNLRFYLPAGINSATVATELLQDPAVEIDGMKVWLPTKSSDDYRWRHESPIVFINTYRQLNSLVQKIYEMQHRDKDALKLDNNAPFGYTVTKLPGVYIGQASEGSSFNGDMANLFTYAINKALKTNNLRTGERVDEEWVVRVTAASIKNAQKAQGTIERSNVHHAFLPEQPVRKIMRAI